MRMMTIASGSSGNCIHIGSNNTHLLIDTGVSRKKICEGLKKADLSIGDINAVFLTHEHLDHIKGAGVLLRKDGIDFYGTDGTLNAMKSSSSVGEIPEGLLHAINKKEDLVVGDLIIRAFPISHDAADPVAYSVSDGKAKIGVITDLGIYDDEIVEEMSGCRAFLAEANHDIKMLQVGPYPYELKRRILSDHGHLSNESSGQLISKILNDNVEGILLGHLSKDNNYDRLAYETVKQEIDIADNKYKSSDFRIAVAGREEPSFIIDIN